MNFKTQLLVSIFLLTVLIFQCCMPNQKNDTTGQKMALLDSATIRSKEIYTTHCSGCHGQQMEAFADRKWKHGKEIDSIKTSIIKGFADDGMPAWGETFSAVEIDELASYIRKGIDNVEQYGFQVEVLESDTFLLEDMTVHLDTIYASGDVPPWGMNWLPNGDMLVSLQDGRMLRLDSKGQEYVVKGVPKVKYHGQGGLFEIELHPDFAKNAYVFLAYGGFKIDDDDTLSTTVVSRFTLKDDNLQDPKVIFEALPYTKKPYHFGGRMVFKDDYLFLSVGDRGSRDVNPQDLSLGAGKIHRFNDDGTIPTENPFYNETDAVKSIWSYGHRNPQGLTMDPNTGEIWSHEHGPRGGDEINIIQPGLNYGWPVISYGINYDGTIFTSDLEKEGMEQPVLYWVPSIAPCGMAWVTSDKYGDWKGDLLVGSLRFEYLNRCEIVDGKVAKEENMLKGIGRLRNVEQGPDGFIYVSVEKPGYVFRLVPVM